MDIRENMLPVLQPSGGKEEVEALREVIESGWWGKGPKVAEFEEKFAKWLDTNMQSLLRVHLTDKI